MIELVIILLMGSGVVFSIGVTLGMMRFPDCYTRIHAAAKSDTLSSTIFLLAFALYQLSDFSWGSIHVSLKLLLILVFVAVASPTASHALVDAAYRAKLEPWQRGGNEKEESE